MMTKDEAMQRLHELLKPGDTVYSILRHRSASGMSRRISLIAIVPDEFSKKKGAHRPFQLDGLCEAIGLAKHKTVTRYGGSTSWKDKEEGLVVNGAGMDMGFDLVYGLGKLMWPKGTSKPHGTRNGEPDRDGGYALNHKWL